LALAVPLPGSAVAGYGLQRRNVYETDSGSQDMFLDHKNVIPGKSTKSALAMEVPWVHCWVFYPDFIKKDAKNWCLNEALRLHRNRKNAWIGTMTANEING
jgi:hypothetical protein